MSPAARLGTAAAVCLAAGLGAAALHGTLAPGPALGDTLRLGVKVAIGVALVWSALRIARLVARGTGWGSRERDLREPLVALAVVALLVVALYVRTPSRLTLNLVGFLSVALPLAWVVGRRAGGRAAAAAAVALGVFSAGAAGVNATRAPVISDALPDSTVKWPAGWPTPAWRLRHELRLDAPLPAAPQRLVFPLARRYEGSARVFARVNGRELGQVGPSTESVEVPIPADMLGLTRFTFELRADRPDPALRVMGFRYGRGATLPGAASHYFDGAVWRTGTYNDAAGRHQNGIYVARVVQG